MLQRKKLMAVVCAAGIGCTALLSGCTEESRNVISRDLANIVGKDLKVSYVDGGTVVKSWTLKGGKLTTGKDTNGIGLGYYYFWSEETGYVQLPIERTVIEEIR